MIFHSLDFALFFALLVPAYWALPHRWQNRLLVAAGAVFYGWVHPWFLGLLYVSAIVDYFSALAMERWPTRKGRILAVSLTTNLAILGYFKYVDFFLGNLAAAAEALGIDTALHPLGVLLPAGISFYTFQSMAYSIDVYRGEIRARRHLLDYLLAVSFFCHLVAGPVQRAGNLLEQAETPRTLKWDRVRSGLSLALWGAFKKVVVADTVSPYVDKVYSLPDPSGALLWAATLGFAVQILADFSGYTDIARGTARMLGWELMENFKHPYLATSPSDFWKRWHISFSTWIRDYVYIPFGGSRGGFWRTTLATFGALGLSGLWHGAAWSFVVWGLYHATLSTAYRVLTPRIPRSLKALPGAHAFAVALMFGWTLLGWMLFRETSLTRIVAHLSTSPFSVGSADEAVALVVMLAVTLVGAAILVTALLVERYLLPRLERSVWYAPALSTAWAVFALGLYMAVRPTAMDFIYFQF